MHLYTSNEPSVVRQGGVRSLWGLALFTALLGAAILAFVIRDAIRMRWPPRLFSEELLVAGVLLVPPLLFALAAEGLRRGTTWAVGLAMTVTIGSGVLSVLVAAMIAVYLSPYDDVHRKQVAAVIGLASLAAAMFKLTAGLLQCGPYLEEVRGWSVRAFEPVMGAGRPADESRGGREAS